MKRIQFISGTRKQEILLLIFKYSQAMKTIKFLLTTIAVLLGSVMANAYDFEVGGIYYNIISATDLTAEVTNGDNKYTGDVIIPSTVNYKSRDLAVIAIGWEAFSGCTELNSITIPNSVKSIEGFAFEDCSSLISITIPDSVTSINISTFKDCSSLTSIIIPNSVITIGWDAFSGCSSLTNITIPNSVISIEDGAFDKCTSLKELRIEDGDTNLEMGWNKTYYSKKEKEDDNDVRWNYYHYGLFYDCPLETLYLGRNLNYTIGVYSESCGYRCSSYDYYYSPFYQKRELKSVTIGSLVTAIREELLYQCYNLQKITIPKNVISIGNRAFSLSSVEELHIEDGDIPLELGFGDLDHIVGGNSYYENIFYESGINKLYLGRNLTTAPHSEYEHIITGIFSCSKLKSVIIGNNVTSINEGLFSGCDSLSTIKIGNNVKSIHESAFSFCDSLTSITIPKNVEYIGNYAFSQCSSLRYLHIEDNEINLKGDEDDAATVSDKQFYNCPIEELYLGRNTMDIGIYLNSIKSLTVGSHVTKIVAYENFDSSLETIILMCSTPPAIAQRYFQSSNYVNSVVYVPQGTLADYQVANVWKDFWDIQEYYLDKKFCINYFVDGELYAVDSVKHGDTIMPLAEPQKENYKFSGWSDIPETMPAEDITITGSFTPNTYTITYMVDEEIFAVDTIAYGDTIALIAEPTQEGYTFSGWSEVPEIMPAEDIIVTGSFVINTYTITYVVDSVVYATDSITYGDTIALLDEPSKEGYTFSGWSEVPEIMPAEDITITGSFTPNTYTITYMVDEEIFAVDTIAYGDTIALIAEPTQEGYTFSGWSEVPEIMPAEDIIVTGSFVINTYTITYVVDSVVYATDSITYGDTIALLDEPSKEGYTFSGWSDIPETMPAEDIIIEGTFNVNYYALIYIVDNEPFATDSLAYGDTIILREEPQKEDFEFSGWSEVPETMPAHDVEVYGNFIFTSVTDVKVDSEQSQKVVEDNQLFIILPNGKKFNVTGQEIGN